MVLLYVFEVTGTESTLFYIKMENIIKNPISSKQTNIYINKKEIENGLKEISISESMQTCFALQKKQELLFLWI